MATCQDYLRQYYLDSLCKIALFPGDYESYVDLKDIYTKLSLQVILPKPCRPVKMPLTSYSEMFTRKNSEGNANTRLLLSAPAGLGKTTITAKIAYDWAKGIAGSPLKDIVLLLVLNMRYINHTSNLEDAILTQIFPEDTKITADQIQNMIQRYGEKIIIIFDAIDESDRHLYSDADKCGSIVKLLRGKMYLSCRLLVTTRPWRITEIARECKQFVHFEITGFNRDDINDYIKKFFTQEAGVGDSLIEHMKQNPLIADIASIPLMALLICLYWKEIDEKQFPNRIGQLYSAIINIMHQHYVQKQKSCQTHETDYIQQLVCRMGKMAVRGFWPPENRVVFLSDEASNTDDVEMACQIGLISKQESRQSVCSGRRQQTLTFFHKTCGEKCAGEYLASLADENPKELESKLLQLKTISDALSIQYILQFTCNSSANAAEMIMRRLIDIFMPEEGKLMIQYVTENLDFDVTLKIQGFIELVLKCNYEADHKATFNDVLNALVPRGNIFFLGISTLTAVALGYYMLHSRPGYIRSLTLRPSEHQGDFGEFEGVVYRMHMEARKSVNEVPLNEMRNICVEYIRTHSGIHDSYRTIMSNSPAVMLSQILVWQVCEDLPTSQESNIAPIIATFKNVHLEVLNINRFRMGNTNINQLLKAIQEGHMLHLSQLCVSSIGMNEQQMQGLVTNIKKMPDLKVINVSRNQSYHGLSILTESLPTMPSLQVLCIDDLWASVNSMMAFAEKFQQFGSRLVQLRMEGNHMNDTVASQLTKHLPIGRLLRVLCISVDGLSKEHHNQLLSAMHYLSRLQHLGISRSEYPDDMMVSVADAMQSLPDLALLVLHTRPDTTPQVNTTTWKYFKAKVQEMSKLKALVLHHIELLKEDFIDLVSLCRRLQYRQLR